MDGTTAQSIENNIAATTPITVGFKRLTEDAVIPTKAFSTDSGFDICACGDVFITPGETVVVPTGISVSLPEGYEATVRPRSGITSRTKIRVAIGTIDNSYNGEIGVITDNIEVDVDGLMLNHDKLLTLSDEEVEGRCPKGTYFIRKGDKLAQLVITRIPAVEAVEVFVVEETDRGDNGFGSTGVSAE